MDVIDKQVNVAVKIIKLLESEQVTYAEYPLINLLVNDAISGQAELIKYPDPYHLMSRSIAKDPSNKIITYEGNMNDN